MKKLALSALSMLMLFSIISCGSKKAGEEAVEPEAPAFEGVADIPDELEQTVVEIVEEAPKIDNTLALSAMTDARKNAIDTGASEYAADYLKSLDEQYEALKARAANGEDVSAECTALAKKYQALAAYVSAKKAKERIEGTEMFSIAQAAYDKGCAAFDKAGDLLADPASDADETLTQATLASTSFNGVLAVIYKQVAKNERDAAIAAKKQADSVKAGVAKKDTYGEAVAAMNKADSLYAMNASDKAYDNYKSAKETFLQLYNDIAEKRAAAQAAIEAAKKRVEESANYALQADVEAPLTEKVAGIEDEDAVLLAADIYEDPQAAEADIPDTLDDGTLKDQLESAANSIMNTLNPGEAK